MIEVKLLGERAVGIWTTYARETQVGRRYELVVSIQARWRTRVCNSLYIIIISVGYAKFPLLQRQIICSAVNLLVSSVFFKLHKLMQVSDTEFLLRERTKTRGNWQDVLTAADDDQQ